MPCVHLSGFIELMLLMLCMDPPHSYVILLYIHQYYLKPHDQRASISVAGGAAIQPPEHVRLWPHRHVVPSLVGDLLAGAESGTREGKSEEAYSCHFLVNITCLFFS